MSTKFIAPSAKIEEALKEIESNSERMVVIASSEDNELLGTITDGDIRRHILSGGSLDSSVHDVMNKEPITALASMSDNFLRQLFITNNIRGIPLVDQSNKFIKIIYKKNVNSNQNMLDERTFGAAIIMAGGEGMRLRPLTLDTPKSMVEINGIPLLERQISKLKGIGVPTIYLAVNYLKDVIKDYFGNGESYGVNIKYVNETMRLGTAGALSLIPDFDFNQPILVMNGDILTSSDFSHIYHFHLENKADITVTAKDYHIEIPYGVIQYEGVKIKSIKEKPSQRFFCNAGIYVLSAEIINNINSNKFLNMTDVIDQCIGDGANVSVFPLHEYWSDIGTERDLHAARSKFKDNETELK